MDKHSKMRNDGKEWYDMDIAKQWDWFFYGTKYVLRNKAGGFLGKNKASIYKRDYLEAEEGSRYIEGKLKSNEPFMAARIGFNEMSMMKAYDFSKKEKFENVMTNMCDVAGFFPKDYDLGYRFLNLMEDSLREVDLLAVMNTPFEEYYVRQDTPKDSKVTSFSVMEFWELAESWTTALKGKKVLVVHPFEESIKRQYPKRKKLFGEKNYLPDFKLITYKAVQTAGGETDERFADWFEALEFMEKEIAELDFDVAILGCGAYGFPLAASIKKMGKQVIHMGGVSQILFGIKGNRWIKKGSTIAPFMNEEWIFPLSEETPSDVNRMEGGPYFGSGNYLELDRGKE